MSHSPKDHRPSPLCGVTVLDCTTALAGPLATQRLADLGARVIKVEGPNHPDLTRRLALGGVRHHGHSTSFLSLNRSKESFVADLASPEGRVAFDRLVERADIVVQNFRPRAACKLGLDFGRLAAINPKLVYVAISGYGSITSLRERAGQDLLVQALTGLVTAAGTKAAPYQPAPVFVVDVATAHLATEAALAGLLHVARQGTAIEFETTMLDAAMELQLQEISTFATTGHKREIGDAPYASLYMEPPYGIYALKDGHLALARSRLADIADVLASPSLQRLAAEKPSDTDLAAHAGWRDAVYREVARCLSGWTIDQALIAFNARELWCGPVNDYAALLADPALGSLFTEIALSGAPPFRTPRPVHRWRGQEGLEGDHRLTAAPVFGSDTGAILVELGFDEAAITAMEECGAVFRADPSSHSAPERPH